MRTVVTFPDTTTATFEDGAITCDDPAFLLEVNVAVADLLDSPSLPDFDHWRATLACEALGCEITAYDGPPTDQPEGEVY